MKPLDSLQSAHASPEAQNGPSPQRDRHLDVYRSVRGPAKDVAREGRAKRGRTGREKRDSTGNTICLGIGRSLPSERKLATTCGISRSRTENTLTEKIIFPLKTLVFRVQKTFFGKNLQNKIFSLDVIYKIRYAILITLGERFISEFPKPVSFVPQVWWLRTKGQALLLNENRRK